MGTTIALSSGAMTPAERASAVAFALRNCALDAMAPGRVASRSAVEYEHGLLGPSRLVASADRDGTVASGVFARTVLLAEHGWRHSGGLDELRAIHHGLFRGIRDDAGELRVDGGPGFFPASLIETGAGNIAAQLERERGLSCLDRDVYVRRVASVYDELGFLHPFAEGNAMVLRIFASRLSHGAGWDLDWGAVTRDTYERAKRAAFQGRTDAFEGVFDAIVRPVNPTRVFLIAGWDQGPAH